MSSKLKPALKPKSRCAWLIKFINFVCLTLGYYYDISKSRRVSFIIKLYCICLSLVSIGFHLHYATILNAVKPYISFVLEYAVNVTIHLVYGDEPFLNFCGAIKTIDRVMGFKTYLFPDYVYLMAFVTILLRMCVFVCRIYTLTRSVHAFLIVTSVVLSIDLSQIKTFIIFAIMHSRIQLLKQFIESSSIPLNISGRNEIAASVKKIRKSLYYYNNLLDNMHYVHTRLQLMLLSSWISNPLKSVLLTLYLASGIINESNAANPVAITFEIIIAFYLVSCPALVVEATVQEVNKIKAILNKQIQSTSDASLRFELETLLQYLNLRPFSYTICRAISLDIDVPFTITSVCITYAIVMMQITHFSL